MSDDSRIEALENEIKILKNEIHATLLDIREQILNHYYPELRADEPMNAHSLPMRRTANRVGTPKRQPNSSRSNHTPSEIQARGQIEPFTDIFLEDLSNDDADDEFTRHELLNSRRAPISNLNGLHEHYDLEDEELDVEEDQGEVAKANAKSKQSVETTGKNTVQGTRPEANIAPQTREVDFRQMKAAAAAAAKREPKQKKGDAPRSQTIPQPAQTELATWANQAVLKVGKACTSQVVETYAMGDKLSDETKASLLHLISQVEVEGQNSKISSRDMIELMAELDLVIG